MKKLLKFTSLSLVSATVLYAGGYTIPEVSTNATALSSANVAHVHSADASYYNPANMIFMKDAQNIEADLIYIGLEPVNFKGSGKQAGEDINAKRENFFIPSLHYVSAKLGNARMGLSVVTPGGLSKRWNDSPAKDEAKEFTLQVTEVNPTAAFSVNKKLAVAVGFRIVYSKGIVKSTSTASRDMQGDSTDFGYNLALSYKPTNALELGATYRSKVDLTELGNAKLDIGNARVYDGGSSVSVPLPATLNLAVAYTLSSKTTIEAVFEKFYWSAYSSLDFHYASSISPILVPYFDAPIAKNWKDSEAYRIGITQELSKLTLMMGAVYDKTPIPDKSVSYELPDSSSFSVSFGTRYDISDTMSLGVSALYSMREDRDVKNQNMQGTFSNANVLIGSVGLGYKF